MTRGYYGRTLFWLTRVLSYLRACDAMLSGGDAGQEDTPCAS